MRSSSFLVLAGVLGLTVPAHAADNFKVSFEKAGEQNTTLNIVNKTVETFDNRGQGGASGNGNGPLSFSITAGPALTAEYTNAFTLAAGANGGAFGAGRYLRAPAGGSTSIKLTTPGDVGINYFGMWISAFDSGNFVDFKRGGTTIFTFAPGDVSTLLGGCGNPASNAYCGNPNSPNNATTPTNEGVATAKVQGIGSVQNEPYAFVNFWNTTGTFDEVIIRQNSQVNQGAGYQTDNHTFGSAVPEPATWAMLIGGFGLAGVAMRRQRKALAG